MGDRIGPVRVSKPTRFMNFVSGTIKFESHQFLSLLHGILHVLASHSRAYWHACAVPITRNS